MTRAFVIGVVLSPRPWSVRLHAFVADHVPDVELVVVRDRRAALSSGAHVLVLDSSTPWLTPAFVAEVDAAGVRLVGVYDRSDGGSSRDRLAGLGLTHLLEEAMPPEDVVFLVDRLRPTVEHASRRPVAGAERIPRRSGRVVAVGGPSGSGAREIALGLATHWGSAGVSTLLVDGNEVTPGVARRLGLALYPHIVAASGRCRSEGLVGVEAALADRVGPLPFDVIVGLATPKDWDRLVPHDVVDLLAACRDGWERIVLTTAPLIEDLQRWGDRFGISRRVLASADVVVGAAEPTPRGALRYLDWLADTAQLRAGVLTVLNKVPTSRRAAWQASQQLADIGGPLVDEVIEVPLDRLVTAAEWDGVVVTRGKFHKAIAGVARAVDARIADTLAVESGETIAS